MDFRILGPLEIADNGRVLQLGTGRQLALVALLLVHRNEVVSGDRIVEQLWGESSPPTAGKIVRNSVSLLRKELGDRLVTRSPGYLLRVDPGELDAERLERAVADGGLETLTQGLALWRGSPLAQFAYSDFARTEIARLEELHLTAIEARIDAELAQGEHARLVPELEALVRANPLRERLREQLMLALYRSGRQADALAEYQAARRTLHEELGLEPGPGLQGLERRILTQDDSLAAPSHTRVARRRRRGGLLIAAGAAALLAGAIAAGVIELTWAGARALEQVAPNSVGVVDPESNRIVAQIPVGASPTRLALTGDSAWVVNTEDDTLSRIDIAKRVVRRTIPLPGSPSGVAADDLGTWVVYLRSSSGSQYGAGAAGAAFVDPRFDDLKRTVALNRLFDYEDAVTLGAGAVWSVDSGTVTRLDPESGHIQAQISIGGAPSSSGVSTVGGIAVGENAVWAIASGGIARIDPATNRVVATIPISQGAAANSPSPTAVAVGPKAVWVTSRFVVIDTAAAHNSTPKPRPGILSRIDPATNSIVATIPVGLDPFGVTVGKDAVWVANRTGFTISRIDPETNGVVATIPVGNRPSGIAADDDAVWISVS
jgi:YVTN family beta-propeller protein